MVNLHERAKMIVECRKEALNTLECLDKILDVFNASDNLDFLVWKVTLLDKGDDQIECCVAFGNFRESSYFSAQELIEHFNFEAKSPLLISMNRVSKLANTDMVNNMIEYLKKKQLEGFSVAVCDDGSIEIKMDAIICENE